MVKNWILIKALTIAGGLSFSTAKCIALDMVKNVTCSRKRKKQIILLRVEIKSSPHCSPRCWCLLSSRRPSTRKLHMQRPSTVIYLLDPLPGLRSCVFQELNPPNISWKRVFPIRCNLPNVWLMLSKFYEITFYKYQKGHGLESCWTVALSLSLSFSSCFIFIHKWNDFSFLL